eukprot:TRINITY_DN2681_c0_g1_i2.p1 TRINITY_DN2681_c0_g1~~TRINITY_DN2681_c0_g1_i2.p1  ORF type:complete len:613 (-),score=130.06 TRINITY_DN2681_c0_g1_i2:125-1963(-)
MYYPLYWKGLIYPNFRNAVLLLVVLYLSKSFAQSPLSECFNSRSTWFADNQHGACMYGTSMGATGPQTYLIAASSKLVFDKSADCGACYEITGPNGVVTVMVVDECTDGGVCNTTFPHLDLAPQAFDILQDPHVAGITDTQAKRVTCNVQGGIKLAVGTNFFDPTGWEIMIFNHRTVIRSVSFTAPGQYTPVQLPRQTYNYWRYSGSPVTWPITISVTDAYGAVATFQPLTLSSGLIIESTSSAPQFPVPAPVGSSDTCPPPLGYNPDGWIYQDQLEKEYNDPALAYINTFQWSDWSYSITINWAYAQNVYDGSLCVQVTFQSGGAIQIGRSTTFAWAGAFTKLQLAARADQAFTGIRVYWKGSLNKVPISITTSWQLFTFDLATDLATPALIGGQQVMLTIQNVLGVNSPTIYFDDIRLIPVNNPTTTTTTTTGSQNPTTTTSSSTTTTGLHNPTTSSSSSTETTSSSSSTATTSSSSSTTTTTTGLPTTATSTTTTTTGEQHSPNTACSLVIDQEAQGGWVNGNLIYTQWTVTISNPSSSSKGVIGVNIVPDPAKVSLVSQIWSVTQSSNVYNFPSWITNLGPGQSFNWGYIIQSGTQMDLQAESIVCSA